MKIKNNFVLEVPILFLVFNRIHTTKKVFAQIQKIKPQLKKIVLLENNGQKLITFSGNQPMTLLYMNILLKNHIINGQVFEK